MHLIAALSALSVVGGATAAADHPSLRHIRSLQDACTDDVKKCEDGSFLNRDPRNKCKFALCPEEELACAMDVFDCGNDNFASRDPAKDCAFEACPKVCTGEDGETYMAPCEGIDGMFCIGESFTALDGCNKCRCSDTGAVSCTKMACPPPDQNTKDTSDTKSGTCIVNGIEYAKGESYTHSDGCNTCTCSGGDTPDACTLMACEPCSTCEDGDAVYCSGASYLASDGCNRCTCGENGLSACTMMACPEPPTPDPDVITNGGGDDTLEDDTTSGAISASIGLSTIAVFLSFLGGTVMY